MVDNAPDDWKLGMNGVQNTDIMTVPTYLV